MAVQNESTDEGKGNENYADKKIAADNNVINNDLWGHDMYPERRGVKIKPSWFTTLFGTIRESIDKTRCEDNVYNCVKDSPIIKLMMGALKSSGCEFDMRRHISCETCDPIVTGGYDSELNQIVICQNSIFSKREVQGTLLHEMIHMFDYCRNKLNAKNIDHLACTEIRAANIAHCSFLSSLLQGHSSIFNIRATHQNCVKHKAKMSVMAIHKVSAKVAEAAVDRVFIKCYNDLEPVGRRIRRNSSDMQRAYAEAHLYGYI